MTVKDEMDELKRSNGKFLAFGYATLIAVVGLWATTALIANDNRKAIKEIRNDYASFELVIYIIESNAKLTNRLIAIEQKDDMKYKQALDDWNKIQQDLIRMQKNRSTRGVEKKIGGG